jgi:hypothetical protein
MSGQKNESPIVIATLHGVSRNLVRRQHPDFVSPGGTGGVGGVGGVTGGAAGKGEGATMKINSVQNMTNHMYVGGVHRSFSPSPFSNLPFAVEDPL